MLNKIMFRVNRLLINRIFKRSLISSGICFLTYFITGRIADTAGFSGVFEFVATGARTELTAKIFSFSPFYGDLYSSVLSLIILSSTITFVLINKYINQKNFVDWHLLLYLPCLLIYASTPTKEFLFYIPALIYIVIECEQLIKKNNSEKDFELIKNISKIILLTFMVFLRGLLSLPYILLASFAFLFKTLNLNVIRVRNLNIFILIFYSVLISLFLIIIIDKSYIIDNLNSLNMNFESTILTRKFDTNLINNFYNPLNFIQIQYFSSFPSLNALIKKPYTLLIVYESIIFIYLYLKLWKKLFLNVSDNRAKLFFSVIFISITSCYFVLYGIIGYINLGSSQRFRTNFIPISLFLPIIAENLISKKRFENNSNYS